LEQKKEDPGKFHAQIVDRDARADSLSYRVNGPVDVKPEYGNLTEELLPPGCKD